jgi:hypothetical protein
MADDKPEINYNEGDELFKEISSNDFCLLENVESKVLRNIIRGVVFRQALSNVLKLAKSEELSLIGINFLTDPGAVQAALRKQGQIMGLTLAVENIIEQAYAWQDEEFEDNGSTEE